MAEPLSDKALSRLRGFARKITDPANWRGKDGSFCRDVGDLFNLLLDEVYRVRKENQLAAVMIRDLSSESSAYQRGLEEGFAGKVPEGGGRDSPVWPAAMSKSIRVRKAIIGLIRIMLGLPRYAPVDASATTFGDLASFTEDDVLSVKNCGRATLNELRQLLRKHGMSFRFEENGGSHG
jgi:hypothetical protein